MRLLLFSFAFFSFTLGFSQLEKSSSIPLDRMSAYSWAGKNGLNSNNITSVVQAKNGYLWLTSYSGIIRFDGHHAEFFNTTNLPFLLLDGFRCGYLSPDNNTLYFASQGDGILKYENNEFSHFEVKNGKVPKSINCLLVEDNKSIYVGSNKRGLFKIDNRKIEKVGEDKIKNSNIITVARDNAGTLWVGTEGNGLFAIKKNDSIEHFTIDNGLQSNVISALAIDNETVYIGTQSGVSTFQRGTLTRLEFMASQSINTILVQDEFVWVGSNNGLGRLNKATQKTEFISSLESLSLTRVNHLALDKEGSLWVATGRDGLVQLRETAITGFTVFDGLSSNKINIIKENHAKDGFYIGCDDGNLFHLKNSILKQVDLKKQRTTTGIRDVIEDANGQLWVASYSGILRKWGNKEVVYGLADGLKSLDVRVLHKAKSGAIWAGSRSGGIAKIVDQEVLTTIDNTTGLNSDFVLSIEEDQKGNIYVGTHSGGLSIISPTGEITTYNITSNDSGVIIFNIYPGPDDITWVVSNLGLFKFNNGVFVPLNLKTKLSGISVFDWLSGPKGGAWITSNQGVIHIPKKEIDMFLSDSSYAVKSRIFNSTDGMPSKECTGAVRSTKGVSGRLWIPTIAGVAVIDPERLQINNIEPAVYVRTLQADTVTYNQGLINIPAGHNRYVINYTAPSFVSPKEMKFRYKLENFDTDYTQVTNVRQVEYTNLPPGDYTFQVTASNNDDVWNETGDQLHFTVEAFYYQTVWFYLTVILFVLALLFLGYKWRVYGIEKMNLKLRKVNSELDSFVYSASHDLRSPLASLLGLIDLSKQDLSNIDTYLNKMQSSVKKLDVFIGDIIDFSSNERKEVSRSAINIKQILSRVLSELDYLNYTKNTRVVTNVEVNGKFFTDKRRLSIILRNLISNAYKYQDRDKEEHFINIDIVSRSRFVKIQVQDNGIGIPKSAFGDIFRMFYRATEISAGSGLGLYIVKETVEKLQGTITVDSDELVGTTFTVTLPSL